MINCKHYKHLAEEREAMGATRVYLLGEGRRYTVCHPKFRFLNILSLCNPVSDISDGRVACSSFNQQTAP